MSHFNRHTVNVVGIYYANVYGNPDLLEKIKVGKRIILRREPDNPHDRNAVAVYIEGGTDYYGYIPRRLAYRLAPILDRGSKYECHISGVTGNRNQPNIVASLTTYPINRLPSIQNHYTRRRVPHRPQIVTTPTGKPFKRIADFNAHFKKHNSVAGIYIIWNRQHKIYVGQSLDIGSRWRSHFNALMRRHHSNKSLQNDWVQMGANEFRFDLIEECYHGMVLDDREKYYIEFFNSYFKGYNETQNGQGIPKPKKSCVSPQIFPANAINYQEFKSNEVNKANPIVPDEVCSIKSHVKSNKTISDSSSLPSSEGQNLASKIVFRGFTISGLGCLFVLFLFLCPMILLVVIVSFLSR